MFIFSMIFAGIVFLITFAGVGFGIAMAVSPKLRGKMLSRQIKANKYAIDESKEDIEFIATNMAEATKDGVKITTSAIKDGFKEETIYCKKGDTLTVEVSIDGVAQAIDSDNRPIVTLSFNNVATKESPSLPEKVLTGCKNSSWKVVPAGILLVLASPLSGAAKTLVLIKQSVSIDINNLVIFFILLSSSYYNYIIAF